MTVDGTGDQEEQTLAGRLIPVQEALLRSVLKAGGQPLGDARFSSALPPWCHRICDELTKSVFGNLVKAAPRSHEFNARNVGRIMGGLMRLIVCFEKDMPARLDQEGLLNLSPSQEAKIEEMMGLPVLFSAASQVFQTPIVNEEDLMKAIDAHLQRKSDELQRGETLIQQYLSNQPVGVQHEVLKGKSEGFVMVVDNKGEFAGKRRRCDVFGLLLMHWPEIVKMQKANPPPTRKALLEWLETQEKRQIVADEKQFFEMCADIGLVLSPPGNPRRKRRR